MSSPSPSPHPFDRLNAIADRLQPAQDRLRRAWAAYVAVTSGAGEAYSKLALVVASVNAEIAAVSDEIAEITGNAPQNIRTYAPAVRNGVVLDPMRVWFDDNYPADFIRAVATYRSFNTQFWVSRGWRGFKASAPLAIAAAG